MPVFDSYGRSTAGALCCVVSVVKAQLGAGGEVDVFEAVEL